MAENLKGKKIESENVNMTNTIGHREQFVCHPSPSAREKPDTLWVLSLSFTGYLILYLDISSYLYISLSVTRSLFLSLSISRFLFLSLSISRSLFLSLDISFYL